MNDCQLPFVDRDHTRHRLRIHYCQFQIAAGLHEAPQVGNAAFHPDLDDTPTEPRVMRQCDFYPRLRLRIARACSIVRGRMA